MMALRIVEAQRNALNSSDVRMEVQLNKEYSLLVTFDIRSTMKDLKLQQEESGLLLSSYPCTLCTASRSEIRDPQRISLGFTIDRTTGDLHASGHLARINPDQLNRNQLGEALKGSKHVPLVMGDKPMVQNSFESLHFKLSMARWLIKILARINAKIYVWSIDQSLRPSLQPYEDSLCNEMTRVLGLQRRMQIQVGLQIHFLYILFFCLLLLFFFYRTQVRS